MKVIIFSILIFFMIGCSVKSNLIKTGCIEDVVFINNKVTISINNQWYKVNNSFAYKGEEIYLFKDKNGYDTVHIGDCE